ncbi:type II toxin-antitoxin system HipA family toxin [Duganella sp. FT92W]|uniref:Type II toxin-antitoxin system HipA family toxin n=1 Tax=Pseudoduganella rivuli TaxID=2666085 RepID=A0A7X2IN90_9BURK|nr:type II toxin-antitoxin system HipA family toxin [Pseudoduganella rivuli]MRV72956.1 type II toxin-antitoxin system HipA family toxin [Pseudoduganella rivuli]
MAAPAALPQALWVYGPGGLVGTLHPTEPLSFRYSASWLANAAATPLHPGIPLGDELIATPYVAAFFENLLPEGDQRKLISLREQVTTVFGLLSRVGGESAGAYVLLPEGESPQAPIYQWLTWEQVDVLVHASGARAAEREAIEQAAQDMPRPRMSISGAQFKVLLYLDEQGKPARPMGNAPSTHILKPDIVRHDISVFASAVNETIVMLAAAKCGLHTARVTYQPVANACLVERYDRVRQADGLLLRVWQADFCQLLGKPSDVKYEHDGGPSFADCYALLKMSVQPAVDRLQLLRWLFFNLCTGNNDSHAKNLSMMATPVGLRLAPFYDLMCTRAYPGLGAHFAFTIAGESEPGKLTHEHLAGLSRTLGVAPRYVLQLATDMARQTEAAISAAAAEVLPMLAPGERVMAERLVQKIASLSRSIGKRLSVPA